jgi:hypothetical protein
MCFGYRLHTSYNGYNGVGGKGINKMIDQLITKHERIPALSTEKEAAIFLLWHWQPYLTKNKRGCRSIPLRL